jgi:amino acid adenylation domain-containing protein/FkbH-like protein/FkbM family methyltransferase
MHKLFKKLDHLGYACADIQAALPQILQTYTVTSISDIVFDEYQNASLCYLTNVDGPNIELVSGPAVKEFLKRGISLYHTCYEVEDLNQTIEELKQQGGLLVKAPYPAPLFNNRQVAFLETNLGLIEILEAQPAAKQDENIPSICISGTFSLDNIKNSLTKLSRQLAWDLALICSEYNQVIQTLYDPNSIFYKKHNSYNIILLRIEDCLRYVEIENLSTAELENLIRQYTAEFIAAIQHAITSKIAIIIAWCPTTSNLPSHINELINTAKQEIIASFNDKVTHWQDLLREFAGEIYDVMTDKIASIPYTEAANNALALAMLRNLHAHSRRAYKLVVVDCDNTLWHGVCAEDGAANIVFEEQHLKLQQKLHTLAAQGVLICLASKNSEADVLQVFAKRTEMPLKLSDIIHYKINWQTKSQNIAEIATVLNLKLDDFVFIDDNPVELAEVSSQHPQILALQFPTDQQQALAFIANAWCLDVAKVSGFDQERINFYKTDVQREQLSKQTHSFNEFLHKLQINIESSEITADDYERISQLSKRTTQFNFCNIQRSTLEIEQLLQQPEILGYKIYVKDLLGDYGLVGALLLEVNNDNLIINSFFLSCRALGKRIEYQFLRTIANQALALKKSKLIIRFHASSKNQPALNFIQSLPAIISYKQDSIEFFEFYCYDILNFDYNINYTPNKSHINTGPINSARSQDNIIVNKALSSYNFSAPSNNELIAEPAKNVSIEDTILAIWSQVLNVSVQNIDNFFQLGGDSLLAIQVLLKIKQRLGYELDLNMFFSKPTIQELANYLSEQHNITSEKVVAPLSKDLSKQLSFTQEWLWILDQYDLGNSWYYNMPHVMRIRGHLNIDALQHAIYQVASRHDVLRMNLSYGVKSYKINVQAAKQDILQIVETLEYSDTQLANKIDELYRQPFNLEKDLLVRAYLLKIAPEDQLLLWIFHHIVSDGWSIKLFNAELSECYNAYLEDRTPSLPELPAQFFDYAAWQRGHVQNISPQQLAFWKNSLQNLPDQQLPLDGRRSGRSHDGKYSTMQLTAELSTSLLNIAKKHNTTAFAVLLTLYAIQIAKRCKNNDVIILCPVSGRRHPDAENLIGCFVNIVVFRFNIDFQQNFIWNLAYNRENIFSALENQDIPYDHILKELRLDQAQLNSSLFQVMFTLQNSNGDVVYFNNTSAHTQQFGYDAARLEFILELEQVNNEFIGGIYYNTQLFNAKTIENYCTEYSQLCGYVTNEHTTLNEFWAHKDNLSILHTPINYPLPPYSDIITWFETTAVQYSNNIALKSGNDTLTYSELNQRANQLAHYLSLQGISAGQIIAIRLPADNLQIICVLAILKIGAVYLPIDNSVPDAYFAIIVKDSGCNYLLCASRPHIEIPHLIVNQAIYSTLNDMPIHNLSNVTRDLAYIIYTSGTTGKPKGVQIPHSNIIQLLASTQGEYNFKPQDCTLLFHSIAFDFSVWELWLALCYGAKLYIPSRTQIKSAEDVLELVIREKVTVLNQTPTAFKQFCIFYDAYNSTKLRDLRLVIFGGEKLSPIDLIDFSNANPHVKFYNMYGITETTVHTTIKLINKADMTLDSNIGRPLAGRSIYILDESHNCVPIGTSGEIFVGGHGLSYGYHNLPERSRAAFLPDILVPTKFMYKTGDLARVKDQELEYLGRKDKQVQLRGFRIELGGIEATINRHPDVKYSAVNVINDQLVAFIAPNFSTTSSSICQTLPSDVVVLPNGLPIHHLNKNETDFLYEEIFAENQYLHAGISLENATCILDVGANIGMFAILAAQLAPTAKIYAIEPIPDIHAVLAKNAIMHGPNIVALNVGLAATNYTQCMSFYPKMSIMSSITGDHAEDSTLITTHIKNKLGDKYQLLDCQNVAELVDSYLEKRSVDCQFVTIDHIIQKNCITEIDLLKIDVEKHELDVIRGISKQNWQIIKQCVIEVHDHDNSLHKIITLLQEMGFTCKPRQYQALKSSDLYVVYASKAVDFANCEAIVDLEINTKWNNRKDYLESVTSHLKSTLPDYMLPQKYQVVEKFPMTATGKIEFSSFKQSPTAKTEEIAPMMPIESSEQQMPKLIAQITQIWSKLLNHSGIHPDDNFFDIGGDSLLTIHAYLELRDSLPTDFKMIDFFNYPTVRKLAEKIAAHQPESIKISVKQSQPRVSKASTNEVSDNDIAIIGYSAKFPQADDIHSYWQNILTGRDCISHFTAEELLKLKVDPTYLHDPNFVKACGKIDDIDQFDADFFGITPREAMLMDPQHRLFLELCWQALESAAYTSEKTTSKIGVFGGMSLTHYLDSIYKHHDLKHCYGRNLNLEITNHRDYLANRVSYKLNLKGASLNINTACSTALVACVKACQSLILGENDFALAGAISLILPEQYGYFCQTDNVLSPSAECSPFDQKANGLVIGSGGGVIVLKRLKNALQDGDNIRAVIKGYAINNDGNQKIGFTAPSISEQTSCIQAAQDMAKVTANDIGYVETHGTGTKLGDQIEIISLTEVFKKTDYPYCALGSVKANIGHADSAAGVAGLIKVILMCEHKKIPPATNFHSANSEIDWEQTPFYFPTSALPWHSLKVAGISSFGIGGTNAHMIVAPAPIKQPSNCAHTEYLVILSAQNQADLMFLKAQLIQQLSHNLASLADVAYSLQVGRKDYKYRAAWLITAQNALSQLAEHQVENISLMPNGLLVNKSKLWLSGNAIDWQDLHRECKHNRVTIPSHPLHRKSYWYTDIVFETKFIDNSIMGVLIASAKKLLGRTNVSAEDDFFELGGDSLAALSLSEETEKKLKVNLGLDDIFKAKTFEKIAQCIVQKQEQQAMQLQFLKTSTSENTLIIIHAIGGSLYCYNDLLKNLNNTKIYGISYESLQQQAFNSIEQLASAYIKLLASMHITGQISLMGWSFGGSVAFEMARQLQRQNITVKCVYLIDSWAQFDSLGNIANDEAKMRDLFMRRICLVADNEWAKHWNDGIWQRSKMLLKYQPSSCQIPTVLFKADTLFPEFASMQDKQNYWGPILGENLTVISLAADHTTIVNHENSKKIAAVYNQHLNQVEERHAVVDV